MSWKLGTRLDLVPHHSLSFFFFNDTATTEIYTLSLHDALPISALAIELEAAEARRRPHGGHCRNAAVTAMELQQIGQVYVGDSVPPRQHEGTVAEMRRQPLDASAGVGLLPGVDEVDEPVLGAAVAVFAVAVPLHGAGLERHAQVGRERAVVGHVALDALALVTERDHELLKAVGRVMHHDVPEDRPAADLDHGLRPHDGFLREPGADAACENAYFHAMLPSVPSIYPIAHLERHRPRRLRAWDALPRLQLAICVPSRLAAEA